MFEIKVQEDDYYHVTLNSTVLRTKVNRNGDNITAGIDFIKIGDRVLYDSEKRSKYSGKRLGDEEAKELFKASNEGPLELRIITHVLKEKLHIVVPQGQYELGRGGI